jgi:hypothetical protein
MLTTAPVRRGHQRLQRLDRHGRILGAVLAVIAHVALFSLVPGFAVPGTSRMTLMVAEWSAPLPSDYEQFGYSAYSDSTPPPVLANGPFVLHRVPKEYPPELWRYREPSSARLQVTINRAGRVTDASLIDGDGGAGELSLLRLTRRMKFRLHGVAVGPNGLAASVQVGILATPAAVRQ